MTRSRCLIDNALAVRIKPPFGESANVAMERSISAASATPNGMTSTPSDGDTDWMIANWPIPAGMVGSRSTAARFKPGAICLSSSSHFPKVYVWAPSMQQDWFKLVCDRCGSLTIPLPSAADCAPFTILNVVGVGHRAGTLQALREMSSLGARQVEMQMRDMKSPRRSRYQSRFRGEARVRPRSNQMNWNGPMYKHQPSVLF
jgi:hypothetical protein